MHLDALEPVEEAEDSARLRPDDDGVVGEAITTVGLAAAVPADADDVAGANLLDHVGDDVGVLAAVVLGAVGANQLDLVISGALDPVVVELVALGAGFDVVAAVLIVKIAMLHPEHRAGVGALVGRHVDGMSRVARSSAVDLDVLEGERAAVVIGAEEAVPRAIVDDRVGEGQIVAVVEDAPRGASGDLEAFNQVMAPRTSIVVRPPARTGRLPPTRRPRIVIFLPAAPSLRRSRSPG